jgi:hypothetical protein
MAGRCLKIVDKFRVGVSRAGSVSPTADLWHLSGEPLTKCGLADGQTGFPPARAGDEQY